MFGHSWIGLFCLVGCRPDAEGEVRVSGDYESTFSCSHENYYPSSYVAEEDVASLWLTDAVVCASEAVPYDSYDAQTVIVIPLDGLQDQAVTAMILLDDGTVYCGGADPGDGWPYDPRAVHKSSTCSFTEAISDGFGGTVICLGLGYFDLTNENEPDILRSVGLNFQFTFPET